MGSYLDYVCLSIELSWDGGELFERLGMFCSKVCSVQCAITQTQCYVYMQTGRSVVEECVVIGIGRALSGDMERV